MAQHTVRTLSQPLGHPSSRHKEQHRSLCSLDTVAQRPHKDVACDSTGEDEQQQVVQAVPQAAVGVGRSDVQPLPHHAVARHQNVAEGKGGQGQVAPARVAAAVRRVAAGAAPQQFSNDCQQVPS